MLSVLPIVVTLLVAGGGWLFTYLNSRNQENKKAELALVNQKLRLLYGPLYARLLAIDTAWKAFAEINWPAHGQSGYFSDGYETTEAEAEVWRVWMRYVFHPMNMKLEEIIVGSLDLVEGGEMPKAFTDALAHIAVYKAVLQEWETGNYERNTSAINFPIAELLAAVEPAYKSLLSRQAYLSGRSP